MAVLLRTLLISLTLTLVSVVSSVKLLPLLLPLTLRTLTLLLWTRTRLSLLSSSLLGKFILLALLYYGVFCLIVIIIIVLIRLSRCLIYFTCFVDSSLVPLSPGVVTASNLLLPTRRLPNPSLVMKIRLLLLPLMPIHTLLSGVVSMSQVR